MVELPNLFIIGAPKCGTTALASWLSIHPEIFAPATKEPHHFSAEYCLTSLSLDYKKLYQNWSCNEKWAIDASVWYLHSPTAVPNILAAQPDARFIVLLRSPLQMIPSMHQQQVLNGNELENDLVKALSLSDKRIEGEGLAVSDGYPPEHLAYFRSCALGWQIERLLRLVDTDRVHFILHEELERSPEHILRNVYKFLKLTPKMPKAFERINEGSARRYPWLDRIAKSLGDLKHRSGINFRLGILSWLRRVNRVKRKRNPLDKKQVNEIARRLSSDVSLLGICIKRDLSCWLDN
ncbi:MAG TPA: hypothetical protein DCE52_02385 [Rhodobacteraceae bacterium]|nr:hypothetical protein [Paracoccaceae bacterium]